MHNPLKNRIIREDMERIFSSYSEWEKLNGKKVYISGANGMIASYMLFFLAYLNEFQNCYVEIYAGVRSICKAEKVFGDITKKNYLYIVEEDVVNVRFAEYDFIIHAASLASPQYYGRVPVEVMLPNIVGTYRLLEIARQSKTEGFLFFSSGSVYGETDSVDLVDESTLGVLDFLKCGNMYGESKRCGEALCKAYFVEYGVPTKAARIHHTYAPTMDINGDTRVFAEFVGNVVRNENIVMKSDGLAMRAFCYITDCVTALYRILLDGKAGESYNVGNPDEYISIKDLACKIALMGRNGTKVVVQGRAVDEGYQPSTVKESYQLDIKKMQRLGWKPEISIEEGFSRVIEYLRKTDQEGYLL